MNPLVPLRIMLGCSFRSQWNLMKFCWNGNGAVRAFERRLRQGEPFFPAFIMMSITNFVTAGYNQGGVMYELNADGKGVKVVWTSKVLDPHHDGAVEIDGKLYGSNWENNNSGKWVCMDWNTGNVIYEQNWENLGKGSIQYADGMLYLYEERRGTVGLAKPGDKFDVVSKFQIRYGTKEHWAHPTISDGILYVRRGDALAAFDIRAK